MGDPGTKRNVRILRLRALRAAQDDSTFHFLHTKNTPALRLGYCRLSKKLRRIFRASEKQSPNRFRPRRVRGRKHFSGCKCASCAPKAHKECAQQTAKNWRKRPQGLFRQAKPDRNLSGWLFHSKYPFSVSSRWIRSSSFSEGAATV